MKGKFANGTSVEFSTGSVSVEVFEFADLTGDCDGDGFTDGEEIALGSDPFDENDPPTIDIFQDTPVCDPAPCIDLVNLDDAGPSGFGTVGFVQDGSGNLKIVVLGDGLPASETFEVFIDCNATHTGCPLATIAGGVSPIGTVVTDVFGDGSSGVLTVTAAQLQASLGAGAQTVHIDLAKGGNDWSTGLFEATPMSITVP